MSPIGAAATSGLMPVLGWTMLHFLWQGTAVALLLWCALALLNPRASQMRYGMCCAALALLVLCPAATFVHMGGLDFLISHGGSQLVSPWVVEVRVTGASGLEMPWAVRLRAALESTAPVLPWIWLAGVAFCTARLGLGLTVAGRMKRHGTAPVADWAADLFANLRQRLHVTRAVRLLESSLVDVPTVVGWLKPVVLLPVSCLSGLSRVQVEALLAHELAHIRRHDYLISVVQGVVEALLFYHPAVWWVSRTMRQERECCCDEVAATASGDRLDYARALSLLEQQRINWPAIALGANGGVLTMRIKRVLGVREQSMASQAGAIVVLSLAAATATAMLVREARAETQAQAALSSALLVPAVITHDAGLPPLPAAQNLLEAAGTKQNADATNNALPNPARGVYRTWLDQDVMWIITPEERAAYMNLTSDEARDNFIRSFWLRRDAPGAPPDSSRAEHYRRIAYANEHFANDTSVGWRTDRGHVYIAYGRPESMESHPGSGTDPAGRQLQYPFEIWHYSSVPGVGNDVHLEFVDMCRCGVYSITQTHVLSPPAGATSEARAAGAASLFHLTSSGSPRAQASVSAASASLEGVVVDPTGAVMPRVTVAAVNAQSGRREVQQTTENGGFAFSLPEGKYTLEAAALGFKSSVAQIAQLNASEPVHLTIKLQVGGISESLRVRAGDGTQPQANTPPNPGNPVRVSAGLMAGSATSQVQPIYPPEAKAHHVQGTVVLGALISKTGEVHALRVVSGPSELQESAMNAVKQWKYRPYLLNGQPAEVETSIRVNYTFGGDGGQSVPAEPGASRQPGMPIRVSAGVMAGQAITQATPKYPEDAKAGRVQGTVVLHAVVSKEGDIENLQIVSGPDQLRDSALDAVKQWRYKPYLLNGEPVEVETTINVNYTLAD